MVLLRVIFTFVRLITGSVRELAGEKRDLISSPEFDTH